MRPFFPYIGSKWTMAPHYGAPIYNTVVEPFAGSAAYSVRHDVRRAVLVEKFDKIAELWRYLIGATPSDIRSLPVDFASVADLDIPDGAKHLIGFWISKGDAEPRLTRSSWARQYRHSHQAIIWNEAARERVARQVDLIKEWQVIEGDFTAAPDVEATWFIDPPYQTRGRACYGHWRVDFSQLSRWCQSRSGHVIVCEGADADWLPFQFMRETPARSRRGRGTARNTELVWTSGA